MSEVAGSHAPDHRGEVEVAISRVRPGFEDLPLPAYATDGAAGMDLRAAVTEMTVAPGGRARVPTGLAVAIPPGFEGSVRPRSGLAARFGIGIVNSPGTIDSDYRGEIQVILVNLGHKPFEIRRGDRVAQLVIAPVARARWRELAELPETNRGRSGFGSTGAR